jgi:hypothetical protein
MLASSLTSFDRVRIDLDGTASVPTNRWVTITAGLTVNPNRVRLCRSKPWPAVWLIFRD